MERSSGQTDAERFDYAWSLSLGGRKREAAALCEEMARAGYRPAHLLLGLIHEFGGRDMDVSLQKAIEHYRRLAYTLPSPIGYVHMARALMKQGEASYPAALRSLQAASKEGHSPQLSLANAAFYETSANPDLQQARRFYLKAALQGRFKGFFGYAEISRKLRQPMKALLADVARVALGPIFLLLFGKDASSGF